MMYNNIIDVCNLYISALTTCRLHHKFNCIYMNIIDIRSEITLNRSSNNNIKYSMSLYMYSLVASLYNCICIVIARSTFIVIRAYLSTIVI